MINELEMENVIETDKNLNMKDIIMLKMFIERGNRSNLFLPTERQDVDFLHIKLEKILESSFEKIKHLQNKENL